MLRRLTKASWRPSAFQCLRHFSQIPVQIPERFVGLNIIRRVADVRSSLNLKQESPSCVDLVRWKPVTDAKDVVQAMEEGGERLEEAPTWVLLYLLSTKIHSPLQTSTAVTLMLRHFPKAEPVVQPSLLILSARFLAKYQVVAPMENVVKAFLMLDLKKPSSNFNLLLQAMSHFRPHPEIARLVVRVLDAMQSRQINLHSRTYRALLSNKLVNLELTKLVQSRMAHEGFRPNAGHLEAFLRVFGKAGAVRASASYLKLIREMKLERSEVAPYGVELTPNGARVVVSEGSANTRWNTQFLRSFGMNAGSAFHFLRNLVCENMSTVDPSPPVKSMKSRLASFRHRTTLSSLSHRPPSSLTAWKSSFDNSDWTTAIFSASRDPTISSDKLLMLLKQGKGQARLAPTMATYTAVLRGLVKKGGYPAALATWDEMIHDTKLKRKIDIKALTVAMDVLVGNGKLERAFATLVKMTVILQKSEGRPVKKRLSKQVVDTELINALIYSLLNHGHPAAVFSIWDSFVPLFGVYPNAQTLTALLRAAKAVSERDHSLRSVIARAGIYNPFWKQGKEESYGGMTRERIAQDIQAKLKASISDSPQSLWNGEPAGLRALHLFRSILLDNFQRLKNIQPPANAVWSDEAYSAHPVRDFVRGMGLTRRDTSQKEENKPWLVGPTISFNSSSTSKPTPARSLPQHPQITPDEKTFAAYIALLGQQHRASEIPLALAWMRELQLLPRKPTLALALVLWSEVSLRGPLLEQYGSVSEYQRLVHWLVKWLGRERMPSEGAMVWARKQLQRERERWKAL